LQHQLQQLLDATTVHVLLVIFVATFIRSAFGFGEALVAVPLLALWIPVNVAAPLAVLVSITIAAVIVVQDWKHIHLRSTAWLVAATFLGIPLGIVMLTRLHDQTVKAVLGALILAFSGYLLLVKRPPELRTESRAWLLCCGFVAGILGGAYGMNGPPLVIYGGMRRWSAQQFRATLQGYFLPASLLGMAGYLASGLWVPAVTRYYLVSLPVVLPTIFLGRAVNQRLKGDVFLKVVYGGLMAIGIALLLQSLRK